MSRSGGNRWLCGKKVDWCLEMYGCCFDEILLGSYSSRRKVFSVVVGSQNSCKGLLVSYLILHFESVKS